jgi:Sulfotransferase family
MKYSSTRTPPTVSALPNFFIVGAPKAGTTSLYYYLGQHPDVYMSPVKEPNYFAEEIRLGNIDTQWQHWAQRDARAAELARRIAEFLSN